MNTIDSIWKKVDVRGEDECWLWIGGWKSDNGYGRIDISNVAGVYSNRAAYLAANPGSISLRAPKNTHCAEFVLHSCDNPRCCNPGHLFLGTHADNMADKAMKQRGPKFKGESSPRAKLKNEDIPEIKRLSSYNLASSEIARLYGVSKPTIKAILAGRHYAGF